MASGTDGGVRGASRLFAVTSSTMTPVASPKGLEQQVAAEVEPGVEAEAGAETQASSPATAPAPPSQAAFAARFARGLLGDLVPPERRPWVLAAGAALLLVVLLLALRACG